MPAPSAVLLATVGPLYSHTPPTALTQAHRSKLKAALELPGAALAVTGSGEYLCIFDQPGLALEAALSFQNAADELADGSPTMAFTGRVVLDVWPATAEQMPVDHAREILGFAREHCILVTSAFAAVMPANQRTDLVSYTADESTTALQGVAELIWRDRVTTFRESTRQISMGKAGQMYAALRLSRRGKDFTVRAGDCPFAIGRDAACALTVGGPNVSRLHGAIQYESGKFFFRDDSRNGTYLTTGGEEVFLHSERFPLVSSGVISPGATLVQQTGDVIRYQCLVDDPGDDPA